MVKRWLFPQFVLVVLLLAGAQGAKAQQSSSGSRGGRAVYLGAGLLDYNAAKAATNSATGAKPIVGQLYTGVSLSAFWVVSQRLVLSPEFYFSPFGKSSPEGGETAKVFSLGLRLFRALGSRLDTHVGSGFLFRSISGSGGTKVLSNGSGQATFGLPDGGSTSTVGYVDLGFGWSWSKLRLDLGVLISGIASSRRAFNPMASLGWRIF